jgi:hypothetical protein
LLLGIDSVNGTKLNIENTGGRAIYFSWEGFHADIMSLRLEGLFLISFITQPN